MNVLVQMREDVREIALVALEVFLQLLPFVWPECAKMCFPKKGERRKRKRKRKIREETNYERKSSRKVTEKKIVKELRAHKIFVFKIL